MTNIGVTADDLRSMYEYNKMSIRKIALYIGTNQSAAIKGDKAPSIARATALLPRESAAWAAGRGNGDAATRSGRAEAALIALWLWRQVQQVDA